MKPPRFARSAKRKFFDKDKKDIIKKW